MIEGTTDRTESPPSGGAISTWNGQGRFRVEVIAATIVIAEARFPVSF
jgi:hypothetical protein